jgi:hypothetical protein
MIRMANSRHISHTGHRVTRRRVLTTGLAAGLALTAPGVLFSPGCQYSRFVNTAQVEDLASRGYVVVTMDHTHETPTEFPGGRFRPGVPADQLPDPEFNPQGGRDPDRCSDRTPASGPTPARSTTTSRGPSSGTRSAAGR